MSNGHVLLVEDEPKLREQLVELLERNLFKVDACADGQDGLHMGTRYRYDVGVIDLGLPKIPGTELIERLRQEGQDFPILILTARGDWQDKVEGLGVGADDYLTKPFHVQELLARLQALMRRAKGEVKAVLEFGALQLDTRAKTLEVSGEPVTLTAFEFKILHYLMLRPGDVVSKSELTEHLYDQDFDRDSNVIEVFVGRLRKKLPQPAPIETVRGQGYRFAKA